MLSCCHSNYSTPFVFCYFLTLHWDQQHSASSFIFAFSQLSFSEKKMECYSSFMFRLRPCSTLSSFFLFLLILSSTQMRFMAEAGRANLKFSDLSEIGEGDQKATLRARIGSSPPKCERRCSWCMHCEAIQVPTNPQVQNGKTNTSTAFGVVAYARREDNSNYKPMSWKCKCGNFIFNP